jgi:hypothetical protein
MMVVVIEGGDGLENPFTVCPPWTHGVGRAVQMQWAEDGGGRVTYAAFNPYYPLVNQSVINH